MSETAYLVLENGKVFQGKAFGAAGDVIGEVVFTTSMVGYLETLTDMSYYGQIVAHTFPLIGNYGVIPNDLESEELSPAGYIVKNWCQAPSNFRSEGCLDTFLKQKNIVGLYDIDTRELTRIIRKHGVMNGRITRNPESLPPLSLSDYRIRGAVAATSSKEVLTENPNGIYKVALLDLGHKNTTIKELVKRNCTVTVFPYNTPADEIIAYAPDGIIISNGPGNPAENADIIQNIRQLMASNIPMLGICLGHQILALAAGFKTQKLKYGHRGANQPAKDLLSRRTYITTQNHGYTVISESINTSKAEEWFVNINDNTCEGILYKNIPVFSVQFYPEGNGGLHDTAFVFEKFMSEMEAFKNAVR